MPRVEPTGNEDDGRGRRKERFRKRGGGAISALKAKMDVKERLEDEARKRREGLGDGERRRTAPYKGERKGL